MYEKVEITWRDANCPDGAWMPIEEVLECEPIEIRSIGYLVLKDEAKVILVQSINETAEQFDNSLVIPTENVIEVTQWEKSATGKKPERSLGFAK